jgi:hypothetical protein
MVLSSVMGGFAYSIMQQMKGPSAPPNMPAEFALMNIVFQNLGTLLVLQSIVAILAVGAGTALLRLKAWARMTLEVLSWLALAYCVGFGIYWMYIWFSMARHTPDGGVGRIADIFQFMGALMGAVVIAVFAVPLWIMIRYLRGSEVRAAISGTAQTHSSA